MAALVVAVSPANGMGRADARIGIFPGGATPSVFPAGTAFWIGYGFAPEDDGEAAMVCERMVDLDEGFQEWRYRHVKMVERTIGGKTGTGGSPRAAYLRTTLHKPAFPDLWSVRSEL